MQIEAGGNNVALEEALIFANEKRKTVFIWLAIYKQSMSKQR